MAYIKNKRVTIMKKRIKLQIKNKVIKNLNYKEKLKAKKWIKSSKKVFSPILYQ